MSPTHALSVRQPYAHAVARLGCRTLTRPAGTDYRGPLFIHAPRSWCERGSHDGRVLAAHQLLTGEALPALDGRHLPTGVLVATAELVDVHAVADRQTCCDPWGERLVYSINDGPGRYRPHHWRLENVTALEVPIPVDAPHAGVWPLAEGALR